MINFFANTQAVENLKSLLLALGSLLVALVAFVGLFISHFFQLRLARKQKSADNRVLWLSMLRDCLAEYLSIVESLGYEVRGTPEIPQKRFDEVLRKLERTYFLQYKIAMMLDSDIKEDHRKLLQALLDLQKVVQRSSSLEEANALLDDFQTQKGPVIELSQQLLRKAWEKVEALK